MKPAASEYRMLAIDLDGTLLDKRHKVPERARAALAEAHHNGLKIVVCTGRSFAETRPILEQIALDLDAAITVGGALISDARSGRTLESRSIPLPTARQAAEWLRDRGYGVLWLYDADEVGFDGYLIKGERSHPAVQGWLAITPCEMRIIDDLPDDRLAPLRVTVVDEMAALDDVAADFARHFDGRLTHNVIRVPMYGFTVLEAFDAGVDKWYGIQRLCERWGIAPEHTVAIGDDVNDLPMIRQAGLGVAVANAQEEVRRAAALIVSDNEAGGVAELVEHLLSRE